MHRSLLRPPARRVAALVAALLLGATMACASSFQLTRYPTNEALYSASLGAFQDGKWDNAVTGFERLTLQLPPRDTLLPRSHYYLAQAHRRRGEDLLAAQSFVRLVESFPGDTLADDALFEAAAAYHRMWRKPALDPQYGELAGETYRTFLAAYPESPLAPEAQRGLARVREWMAEKDYGTGAYYQRRRAYDSAIIYYRDVVSAYPETQAARRALFGLHDIYERLNYREEAQEVCTQLRTKFPADAEVRSTCGAAPPAAPVTPPPDTGAALPAEAAAAAGPTPAR